jgi:hypothetical protein
VYDGLDADELDDLITDLEPIAAAVEDDGLASLMSEDSTCSTGPLGHPWSSHAHPPSTPCSRWSRSPRTSIGTTAPAAVVYGLADEVISGPPPESGTPG